jgi:hypothetical protein
MARPTIKSINSIKSLGIFHSFKKTDQIDFKEKTIVYGWNGTGKSTLARLFRALETKQPLEEFPKAEFEIELSDGSKIKHNTLSASNLNMRVFNKQFVDANINWDETNETSAYVFVVSHIGNGCFGSEFWVNHWFAGVWKSISATRSTLLSELLFSFISTSLRSSMIISLLIPRKSCSNVCIM